MYRADDPPEEVARARASKGKLRDDSASVRMKIAGGIVFVLLAACLAVYLDLH
jgi:hypothetical protein